MGEAVAVLGVLLVLAGVFLAGGLAAALVWLGAVLLVVSRPLLAGGNG